MIDHPSSPRLGDTYLVLLSGVLLGYAMLGKGFAYLGFPPLYIGEIALLTGIAIVWRPQYWAGALTTLPALLLAATMVWVLLRTLPFVSRYGTDALRDSVIVMYGGFAFITAGLLLENGQRLNRVVRYYGKFLDIYVPSIPFIYIASRYLVYYLPKVPGTDVPVVLVQSTEVAVHLTAAAVFALVGLRKVTRLWLASLVAGLVMVGAVGRGAMLAEILPITAAALSMGKGRQLARTCLAGLVVFSVAYVVEPVFFHYTQPTSSVDRPISTRQVVDNVLSIVGQGGGAQEQSTKEWRLEWWKMIVDNTVFGANFWTGRGFGLNIAQADGFSNWTSMSREPPLRSPHDAQMTMLARAGVPGLALWLGLLVSWFGMMTKAMLAARHRGQMKWAGLFVFLACYAASIIINASFDPALDGPMQGVWFWSLFGFGIGSVLIYRCQRGESPYDA